MMNFEEHQTRAQETIRGDNDNLEHYVPKLFTEVSELLDMFMAHRIYGKPLDPINVLEECGDAAWYRANIYRIEDWPFCEDQGDQEYDDPFRATWAAAEWAGSMMGACRREDCETMRDYLDEVFFALTDVLTHFGFTWSDAYEANMKKLLDKQKGRYKDGHFTKEAAVNRDTDAERELLEEAAAE